MGASRIIRYPVDIISVLVVLSTLSLQLFALLLNWPWYAVIPILLMLRQVSLVEHNHAHLTIFPEVREYLSGLALPSLQRGLAGYLQGPPCDEPPSLQQSVRFVRKGLVQHLGIPRRAQIQDRPVGKAYYVASFPFIAHGETLLWFLRSPTSKLARGFFLSTAIVGSVSVILLWLNAGGFVTFFLLPWAVLLFGMGYNNYDHHVGCKMTGKYDSANNFVNFYYTVLSFNKGYHVAHHLNPGVHWSLLPHLHDVVQRGRLNESVETFARTPQPINRNLTPTPEYPARVE